MKKILLVIGGVLVAIPVMAMNLSGIANQGLADYQNGQNQQQLEQQKWQHIEQQQRIQQQLDQIQQEQRQLKLIQQQRLDIERQQQERNWR